MRFDESVSCVPVPRGGASGLDELPARVEQHQAESSRGSSYLVEQNCDRKGGLGEMAE